MYCVRARTPSIRAPKTKMALPKTRGIDTSSVGISLLTTAVGRLATHSKDSVGAARAKLSSHLPKGGADTTRQRCQIKPSVTPVMIAPTPA